MGRVSLSLGAVVNLAYLLFSLSPVFGGEGRGEGAQFDALSTHNSAGHPTLTRPDGHPLPRGGRGLGSESTDPFSEYWRNGVVFGMIPCLNRAEPGSFTARCSLRVPGCCRYCL